MTRRMILLVSMPLLFGLSACGGGGGGGGSAGGVATAGGGTIDPGTPVSSETAEDVNNMIVSASAGTLALDSNISIIPSSDPGASLVLSLATSDYDDFKADTFTWEPSQQPMKMLNNIMCVFSRTGYHLYANEGPYLAKVSMDDCFRSDNGGAAATPAAGAGEGGQSNSSQPVTVTVQAIKDEGKPLVASIWFTKEGDDQMYLPGFNMYAQVTIAEPMSDENPFGIFNLKWQALKVENSTETTTESMYGYIDVGRKDDGNVLLKFRGTDAFGDSFSTWSVSNEAIAILTVDPNAAGADRVTAGLARTAQSFAWSYDDGTGTNTGSSGSDQSGSYAIAFDKERIVTQYSKAEGNNYWYPEGIDPEAPTCRTRNENYANIFSYAFFKSDGSRLKHQTGYPIVTGKTDEWGWPITGWVDSWGLYLYGVDDNETVWIQDNAGNKTAYTFETLNGTLRDDMWQSITISAPDMTLTCQSSCLKASISAADASAYQTTMEGGPFTYQWDSTTKELKYNGAAVSFQSDVTDAWASMSLTDASGNSYQYEMSQSQWSQAGALKDPTTGTYFQAPGAIEFSAYVYNDAQDAYPGNSNATADGKSFNLSYDGWSLQGIDWADTGRDDQFGYDVWGPEIALKKGTTLTVANTINGVVTAGDSIRIAPAWVELQPKIVTDCSQELYELADSAPTMMDLPDELSADERNMKGTIGAKPAQGSDGGEMLTRVKDGEAL